MISQVIQEDTGCSSDEARLLGVGLVGMAEVSARYWMHQQRLHPQGRRRPSS